MATIVFCEDNPSIRKLIEVAMRGSGHSIFLAEDGAIGLELIRKRMPQLVVTDLAMPVLDGLGLYHALRGDPALSSIKIVFLTASTQQGMMGRAKSLVVDAFLTKPFSPLELRAQIERVLAR